MIKLSVSKAAKMLGISRFDIQNQINNGKLQTHEGYVTTDSLRLAYPNISLNSEQDQHIHKMQQIKNNAVAKMEVDTIKHDENEKGYITIIDNLRNKLYQEELKNQHFELVFSQLTQRLEMLEKHCHSADKAALNQ
ncbi:MAG: hypothetical protein FXV80_02105, partial [Candidatus Thioglobus sp.]